MTKELETSDQAVVDSTGNVFADLDLPSSEADMAKINIARAITNTIRKRDLTQAQAAEIVGMDQAKISAVMRGRVKGFTVERLFRILIFLGRDVDIHISRRYKTNNQHGRIKIMAA